MTIEELKALLDVDGEDYSCAEAQDRLHQLAPEILALVEAVQWLEGCVPRERFIHGDILKPWDAFNAKLTTL